MGMNAYTHVGPFLMIPKVQRNVTKTIRVYKSGEEVKTGFNFDPVTGEEYATKEVVKNVTKKIRPWGDDEHSPEFEKLGLDEDTFWEPEGTGNEDYALFLPSSRTFKESDIISLKGLDIEDELSKFIAKHVSYIQYYEKVYGPIIVDYGVVEYWA